MERYREMERHTQREIKREKEHVDLIKAPPC